MRLNEILVFLIILGGTLYGTEFDPHEHLLTRTEIISVVWPTTNPVDQPEAYLSSTEQTGPDTWQINYHPDLSSRLKWYRPLAHDGRKYAIYHEGHAPDNEQTVEGLATTQWLLARGWTVVYVDMPIRGTNAADKRAGLGGHNQFTQFEDDGTDHPIGLFLQPVSDVVSLIYEDAAGEPTILMIGRSGGGWTTLWYSAFDSRIDYTVVAMGFVPTSMRLRPTLDDGMVKIGDYEQSVPEIYERVSYEDLVNLLSKRKVLYLYNGLDPCCFNVMPDDPYIAWLEQRGRVFVDPDWSFHSISPAAYDVINDFLEPDSVYLPLVAR